MRHFSIRIGFLPVLLAVAFAPANAASPVVTPGGKTNETSWEAAQAPAGIPNVATNEQSKIAPSELPPSQYVRKLQAIGKANYAKGFGNVTFKNRKSGMSPASDAVKAAAQTTYSESGEASGKALRSLKRPRKIMGEDGRVRIRSTKRYPFRTFGPIRMQYGDGWSRCSATLIGPRTLLTAAHCLYGEKDGYAKRVIFYPGANGEDAPFGAFEAVDYTFPSGYLENTSSFYDIAVVKLAKPIGDELGWLGYSPHDPVADYIGNIIGYPADKPYTQWRSSCDFQTYAVNGLIIDHWCDTKGGSSGSAVYDYDKGQGTREIKAVHILGRNNSNGAIRISSAIYNWIIEAQNKFEQ